MSCRFLSLWVSRYMIYNNVHVVGFLSYTFVWQPLLDGISAA